MHRRGGLVLLSTSHVVDDLYQGAVPAALPFFVAERNWSYTAVSGLVLAATVAGSVAQPLFGMLADRRDMHWLVGAGIIAAGVGVGLAGVSTDYLLTWLAVALSGLGVAAYHPEAARAARAAAGDSSTAMSVFAVGGNLGFATGPMVVAPVLLAFGLAGTPLLMLPALVMGAITLVALPRLVQTAPRTGPRGGGDGRDDWGAFGRLTAAVIARSMVFFGVAAFLSLYFIDVLGASTGHAATALTVFLASGAVGTLLGGRLADRFGRLPTARGGFLVAPVAIAVVLLVPLPLATVAVAVVGVVVLVPFTVLVTLGQDYLPARVGTASGVTLGLGIGAGGLVAPALGVLADAHGLVWTLGAVAVLPLAGVAALAGLRDPRDRAPVAGDAAAGGAAARARDVR